jgi:hypothetical protein
MRSNKNSNNQLITSTAEEILDPIALFNVILIHKKIIFIWVTISILLAISFISLTQSRYESFSTFFIPPSAMENSKSSILGNFGLNSNNLDSLLIELIKTDYFSLKLSSHYVEQFENDIEFHYSKKGIIPTESQILSFTKKKLALDKWLKISSGKNSIIKVKYLGISPEESLKMINIFITELLKLNNYFQLSANKKLLIIVDTPILAEKSNYPNFPLTLFMSILLGIIVGFCHVTIKELLDTSQTQT